VGFKSCRIILPPEVCHFGLKSKMCEINNKLQYVRCKYVSLTMKELYLSVYKTWLLKKERDLVIVPLLDISSYIQRIQFFFFPSASDFCFFL